jgi:hypothetical protein
MAFESLTRRLTSLPLILAGPILRRVERSSVTVWIACRDAQTGLTLEVHDAAGATRNLRSDPVDTVALGDHLHVALVTAEAESAGAALSPGRVYTYDVLFPSHPGGLAARGVLSAAGGTAKVAYGDSAYPSFVLPATQPGGLRFAHGSCRKPHGGAIDALNALDVVLESTHADVSQRPQQLFLTGDQIYADDVADAMLFMLQDASNLLLGWKEDLSVWAQPAELAAGRRQSVCERVRLSSSAAKSHLIRLGEFYCMYLFAWSPECWPPDTGYPDASVLHGGDAAHFADELNALRDFRFSLDGVRRALANVAVYMAFDDHEITDDWFLTRDWCTRTLAQGTLSRRLLQNGLAAYGVFQFAGNVPSRFAPAEPGGQLMSLLAQLHQSRGRTGWEQLGTLLLPALATVDRQQVLQGGFTWNFYVDFDVHRAVVLDTRTRRAFSGARAPANLIAASALTNQLPAHAAQFVLTVVLSPAPVFGHTFLETMQQPARFFSWIRGFLPHSRTGYGGSAWLDHEAWSFDRWGFEHLLDELARYGRVLILSGDVHYSFTAAVKYWHQAHGRQAAMVQLCSSSFKNSTGGTRSSDRAPLRAAARFAGWQSGRVTITNHRRVAREDLPDVYIIAGSGNPAVAEISSDSVAFSRAPEWLYDVNFARDDRDRDERVIPQPGELPPNPRACDVARHRQLVEWDLQRTVGGYDTLALISVQWSATDQEVRHELWYSPGAQSSRDAQFRPHTAHDASLTLPLDPAPTPGGT